MTEQTFNLISILLGILVFVVTAIYSFITFKILKTTNNTYELSKSNSITEVHNRFQTSMRDIQLKFPVTINSNEVTVDDPLTIRCITLYWYLVLDEFLTCKVLSIDPKMNDLWDKHYIVGVTSALNIKSFYFEIAKLLDGGSTLLGIREQFEKEIIRANNGVKPSLTNFNKR
jgi:hypothetical protein